jgi:hypothetical protein
LGPLGGQSAARIFSWDKGPHTAVQVNAGFKLTVEQLEEMRALCDSPFKKPAVSEGDAISPKEKL